MAIDTIVGQSLSAAGGALKTVYIGGLQAIFPTDTSTLKWLKMHTEGFEGLEIKGSKNVARNQGFGASHATDDSLRLADPHRNTYANPKASMGNFSMRGKIPGKLMQRVKSDRGGFIKLLVADQAALMRDAAFDMDQQLYGDGSGRVAIVTAVGSASAGSLTLKHPFDCPSHATAGQQGTDISRHRINTGGVYAFVDASASTTGAATQAFHVSVADGPTANVLAGTRHFLCSAISGNVATFTFLDGTAVDFRANTTGDMEEALAVGDAVVRCVIRESTGLTAPTAYTASTAAALPAFHEYTGYRRKDTTETTNTHFGAVELIGFPAYCSESGGFLEYNSGSATAGNIEGISYSTYPDWKGYVQQGGTPGTAEAGTRRKFMLALQRIQLRGEKRASRIFTSPVVLTNMLEKFVHSDIQYSQVAATTEIAGRDVTFQGTPIVTSEACPDSAAFLCPDGALSFYQMMDIEWVNQDGAILSRMGDHYDFQYSAVMFAQTFTERPNHFAAIYDLQSAAW